MSRIIPALLGATICISMLADTTGRIAGKVLDKAGKPVPNATILLKRTTEMNWSRTLKVSSNGSYSHAGLAPKEFEVTASAEGFAPQVIQVKIPLGETITKDFQLLTLQEARTATPKPQDADPTTEKAFAGTESYNQALTFYNDKNYIDALPLTEKAYKDLSDSYSLLPAEKKPEMEPRLAKAERLHSVVLFEVGKQDEARQKDLWNQADPLLKAALARNAKDQRVLDCLVEVSKAKGDAEGARKYEEALIALIGPRPELAYNQGVTAYNNGDLAGAKPFFLKAIQADPKFAEAYYLLAMCEFAENNLRGTKQSLLKYLEVAPKGKHAEEVKAMLSDPSLKSIK